MKYILCILQHIHYCNLYDNSRLDYYKHKKKQLNVYFGVDYFGLLAIAVGLCYDL